MRIENGVLLQADRSILSPLVFPDSNQAKHIVVPDGVTRIGQRAFVGIYDMESLILPDSVTQIDKYAFYWCAGLQSVTIPDSVNSIGAGAFYGCSGLADKNGFIIVRNVLYGYCGTDAKVVIPDNVVEISEEAFTDCRFITSITIPDSVKTIGAGAFYGCEGLADENGFVIVRGVLYDYYGDEHHLQIPDNVVGISDMAFDNANFLETVSIPESVQFVGGGAFCGCQEMADNNGLLIIWDVLYGYYGTVSSLVIPENVVCISDFAFEDSPGLKSIVVGPNVKKLCEYAFDRCKDLQEVTILGSIACFEQDLFWFCERLEKLTVYGDVTCIAPRALENCKNLTIHAPAHSNLARYAQENNIPFVSL